MAFSKKKEIEKGLGFMEINKYEQERKFKLVEEYMATDIDSLL